jgi:hypothetical protein
LYWYGSRWYDPELSRWNQPDSIIPNPGDSTDWDRYNYVRNNPLKYVDPDGHIPFDTILDLLFIAYDVGAILIEGPTPINQGALAADAICAIIPYGTGGGFLVRAGGEAAIKGVIRIPAGARLVQVAEKLVQFTLGSGDEEFIDQLLDAANKQDRNGFTKGGRGLQKHGGRSGSAYPKLSGNPNKFNSEGSKIIEGILRDPRSIYTYGYKKGFGNILEVRLPNGRGIRYNAETGEFIGFLEPPYPKGR